ncbi:D-ribitol-5-phosphate cytidylyltransferase-like isoform X2 [Dendronephthya gigantea]|uniref:D-ribitol-5-phosphate cytidylyltransferase-like isoform X2 n=1 Tax=Dendronephthya gigantea TaxID=151771 RepID=UPI00106CE4F4|nr:D-ribitol-5-phosphate cytidylyltransferase-like isoform X2 [Dendronephthya gigantea]
MDRNCCGCCSCQGKSERNSGKRRLFQILTIKRHGSIYNGVCCLNTNERKPDIVIIHDAVRPFIEEVLLKEIVIAAQKHSACGVVRPLVSTVLAKNACGFLDHSLDRSQFVASEMPQAFKYDVIFNAYQKCTPDDFQFGTECLNLALKYSNVQAFLIDGPDYLWKVTYKKDILAAKGIIAEQLRRRAVFSNEIGKELFDLLKKEFETNGVESQNDETDDLCKVNILINSSLLQQDSCVGNDLKRNSILKSLVRIERNGVLVIIDGGNEEKLAELRKATESISRKSRIERVICCGVWCKDFSPALAQRTSRGKIARFANMIVNVAMETSLRFNGQVFTVLDLE